MRAEELITSRERVLVLARVEGQPAICIDELRDVARHAVVRDRKRAFLFFAVVEPDRGETLGVAGPCVAADGGLAHCGCELMHAVHRERWAVVPGVDVVRAEVLALHDDGRLLFICRLAVSALNDRQRVLEGLVRVEAARAAVEGARTAHEVVHGVGHDRNDIRGAVEVLAVAGVVLWAYKTCQLHTSTQQHAAARSSTQQATLNVTVR